MTVLEFIVKMTKALAWPVAVVIALAIFRRALPGLMERISSLKYGSFEAAFAAQSVQVAQNISDTSQPLSVTPPGDDELLELAERSPRAGVIEAWLMIERQLHELAKKGGISAKIQSSPSGLIRALRAANSITTETERALLGLVQLRNLAAHAPGQELTAQKAVDFVTYARALLWVLRGESGA